MKNESPTLGLGFWALGDSSAMMRHLSAVGLGRETPRATVSLP